MPPANHPVWKIVILAMMLLSVGGYMEIMYRNGFDPLKDGVLLSLMGGLAIVWSRISGEGNGSK